MTSPLAATEAFRTASSLAPARPEAAVGAADRAADGDAVGGFGDALQKAVQGAIDTGHRADAQSAAAVSGAGDLTKVVTAVSRAELALQTSASIRDRVIQSYQDIMHMAI